MAEEIRERMQTDETKALYTEVTMLQEEIIGLNNELNYLLTDQFQFQSDIDAIFTKKEVLQSKYEIALDKWNNSKE